MQHVLPRMLEAVEGRALFTKGAGDVALFVCRPVCKRACMARVLWRANVMRNSGRVIAVVSR